MSDRSTTSRDASKPDRELYDPTYLHTRREAAVILIAWVVCLVWTVGYCWWAGYGTAADGEVSTVFGMPSWVFWGVALPWATALTFSVVYGLWFIADDDLGEVEDEETASREAEATAAKEAAGSARKGGGDA